MSTAHLPICIEWAEFKRTVTRYPFDGPGFHACDHLIGWLHGYAAFCEEDGDFEHAEHIRSLIPVSISVAADIRRQAAGKEEQT